MSQFITLERFTRFTNSLASKMDSLFVKKEAGKVLSSNDYTNEDVQKLANIKFIENAEVGSYNTVITDDLGNIVSVSNKTDITELGIEKVNVNTLDGIININNIPKAALERLISVETDEERFALTIDTVQLGDTVKVNETGEMYFVVDTEKLNEEAGYKIYSAGKASSVDWSGVKNIPEQIKSIEDVTTTELDEFIDKLFGNAYEIENEYILGPGNQDENDESMLTMQGSIENEDTLVI